MFSIASEGFESSISGSSAEKLQRGFLVLQDFSTCLSLGSFSQWMGKNYTHFPTWMIIIRTHPPERNKILNQILLFLGFAIQTSKHFKIIQLFWKLKILAASRKIFVWMHPEEIHNRQGKLMLRIPPTMNVDIGKKIGIMILALFCEVLFYKSIMWGLSRTACL